MSEHMTEPHRYAALGIEPIRTIGRDELKAKLFDAGLRYFEIIQEKLKERGADYKVLYAFSDFTHPQTNEAISEHAVNELGAGEEGG